MCKVKRYFFLICVYISSISKMNYSFLDAIKCIQFPAACVGVDRFPS